MKSLVAKRSIILGGHKTSVSLENAFWMGLKDIARNRHTTLSHLVDDINAQRETGNLSSAIRLFVLDRVRAETPGASENNAATSQMNGASPKIADEVL